MDQLPPVPENYVIPENEPDAVEGYMSPKATTPAVTMRKEYDEREWRIYRWIYCRLTELVDQHIQRILDELQNEGLEENTLIVFTSDHGNMDASHRLASKGLFYEESVKVPFLMKYRDVIPAGGVETGFLVSTGLDILPTLCDYAGIKPPDTLLGMSVKLIAEGKRVRHRRRYVVSENGHGRMLRTRQYKYCVYDTGSIRESLVDILNDPGELINLAQDPKYQEVIITHRRLLQEWVDESDDVLAKDII